MCRRMLAFGLALIFLAAQSALAQAQQASGGAEGSWDSVRAVPLGEKIVVRLKDGKSLQGRLGGVSDSGLNITRNKSTININRTEVQRIHRVVSKSGAQSALIGAGVGVAVGAGGTAAVDATDDRGGVRAGALLLPLVGAGTGALIGLAIGRRQKRVLIYESQ